MRDELQQLEEEMLKGRLVLPIKSTNELIPENKENDWWVMHFPFNGFNIDKINISFRILGKVDYNLLCNLEENF